MDTQLSLLWQIDILCALYVVFKCLSKWIHGYADSEMRRDYGSVYMRKLAPVWLSYQDDFLIFYDVYTMTGSFHIMFIIMTVYFMLIIYTWLWFKITNIMHALPTPVYLQTDFTPKWVVVSCVHDTVVKFCTGVKFLLLYNNRDELTLVWLTLAWHFVVVSCKQIQSHEREPKWTCTGAKVALLSCKQPLSIRVSTHF